MAVGISRAPAPGTVIPRTLKPVAWAGGGWMTEIWRHLDVWARWLLQPRCQLCGLGCPGPEDLCPACRPTLRPLPGGLEAPRGTARQPFAPFCYGSGAQALAQQLKFHRQPEAARLMATLMAEALPRPFSEKAVVLVPLPLHWRRRLQRGFDQAQLLSLWLHRLTGLPLAAPLRRRRATAPQSRLPRGARVDNLAGAFNAAPPPQTGLRPVLVDDVATTGATLRAGREALLAAGWAPPLHWVFAWTLPPSPP